jgi:hypothetical protein
MTRDDIKQLSVAFDLAAKRRGLSEATCVRYRKAAREFIGFIQKTNSKLDIIAFQEFIESFYQKPAKCSQYFCALKFFFEEILGQKIEIRISDFDHNRASRSLIDKLLHIIRIR